MYKIIFYAHLISVNVFLVVYLYKLFLLLANKDEKLTKFSKDVKVAEMIISFLFLFTGIYMMTQIPEIKSMLLIKIVAVLASIPLAVIGFKKKKKVLAVASIILIIAAYGLAEMSKKQKSKVAEGVSESSVNGEELYVANCAKCHGADGKLNLMGAKDLSVSTMDLNARIEVIKNGKGAMAAFSGMLNEQQIKAVATYTETLK